MTIWRTMGRTQDVANALIDLAGAASFPATRMRGG
jgi:hypothetical protein